MIRFVLLIAFVACAETQVNVTDCPPENAAELAAREASNAYLPPYLFGPEAAAAFDQYMDGFPIPRADRRQMLTKQAAAAAHKANCAFYLPVLLDAPDASVGYRAAMEAVSDA